MFGERLKNKRIERNMTQTALADIVGVVPNMITQIERGTKQASAPLIAQISAALDCTTDSLILGVSGTGSEETSA